MKLKYEALLSSFAFEFNLRHNSVARQQKVTPLKPARPRDELFTTLRGESPAVFRFSTWDDADDTRELSDKVIQDADRDMAMQRVERQGLTLVRFSAPPKFFWSHLHVSPCSIDWGKIVHLTYPTKCAYVDPKSTRV